MDIGYFLHHEATDAVDHMVYGSDGISETIDPSYYLYDEQIIDHGNIYSELALMTPRPQNPTPHASSPENTAEQDTVVSISTAFYPGAHALESDVCFSSSDAVLFYVHSQIIRAASETAFASGLPSENSHHAAIVNIPDEAAVLNVILHTLYGTSCAQHSPSLETLVTAVERMSFYNLDPKQFIRPGLPLYMVLLSCAPLYPIDIYSLAAKFNLEDLAINSSSHLLSYPLSSITDEMAQRMGATYLKRLMCLHHGRNAALRDILLVPPPLHPQTKECTFADQKRLTRAWALVSAYLAWDARSDLSTRKMHRALEPLTEQLTCEQCHQTLKKRMRDASVQWASVKVQIIYCLYRNVIDAYM
ncbi:hypothetical protein AX14_003497 [Amanita brunnescens Koide BX004]|nr:hypothetical protein AX14_003497 [Amanita brunnescens Koide BX004]